MCRSTGHWRCDCAQRARSLQEDEEAHRREHSLEVEIPFLQEMQTEFTFVPVAVGSTRFEELVRIGEGVADVIAGERRRDSDRDVFGYEPLRGGECHAAEGSTSD